MNLKNSLIINCLILVLLPLFFSCNEKVIDLRKPEFSITEPLYKSAEEDNRCVLGGVYFDLYNKSDSAIVFMETRMNVFDKETGKAAFTGYGTIISESEISIQPGEKRNMCIPLDKYITVVPKAGYIIDQFYISRLEYADGRIWEDDLGVYAVDSRE